MKYKVTLILDTDEGNPRKWNWSDLLDEVEVLEVEADLMEVES